MTEEDFLEYIGKLWSMLIWGNKSMLWTSSLRITALKTLKKQLVELLYGEAAIEKRWDVFSKKT